MKIQIVDRGPQLDAELHEQAERRLRYALTRFEPQVVRVLLVLQEENGARGGRDKACRIDVYLRHGDPVSVSDLDGSLLAAVSRAADRVGRAVNRRLSRDGPFRRHPGRVG